MSKTIKVIDLLNKIANGEKPKKIKFKGIEFVWEGIYYRHFSEEDCVYETLAEYLSIENELNSTVEIMEEQEEIDIQNIEELEKIEDYEADPTDVKLNRQIINKLVQAVKQLDKKIKEK
jgi:hypothetical protein